VYHLIDYDILPYASRTGTKVNLNAMRSAGWRLLVTAGADLRTEGFEHYALDNGAWGCYTRDERFNTRRFVAALKWAEKQEHKPDWIVAPDLVGCGLQSLHVSCLWLDVLPFYSNTVLIPAQDGMLPSDLSPLVGPKVGIFLGGTTDWKLKTGGVWGELARERDCWFHVGRVNSQRRLDLCRSWGAHSFDGSGASRYLKMFQRMQRGLVQGYLFNRGL